MGLKGFIQGVLSAVFSADLSINSKFRFTQREINEIISTAKKANLKYFEQLSKIKELSAFDVSFLMSNVELNNYKIQIIKHACLMYDEKEFCALGQTFSDFIFRVSANINYLNESNLDIFKELVQCKNELYDFSDALKNPLRAMCKKHDRKPAYAFQNVFVD